MQKTGNLYELFIRSIIGREELKNLPVNRIDFCSMNFRRKKDIFETQFYVPKSLLKPNSKNIWGAFVYCFEYQSRRLIFRKNH